MHSLDIRVYYENTDAAGIVYHADYLCFAERGRTEMLRHFGFEHVALKNETGVAFAVRSLGISYHKPAKLDENLTVRTKITSLSGVRMDMAQSICRKSEVSGEEVLSELTVQLVCINEKGKPVRLPEDVKMVFEKALLIKKD